MQDAHQYGPAITPLLRDQRLNELGPGRPNEQARSALGRLTAESAFPGLLVSDCSMAEACLAGLWLYHDFLDESHTISQGIATPEGSFWHAIMHRREPDPDNSKYWWHRVGTHPVFESLRVAAVALARRTSPHPSQRFLIEQTQWDPDAFVDLCEACRTGRAPGEVLCRKIQLKEWELLFEWCYRQAVGKS